MLIILIRELSHMRKEIFPLIRECEKKNENDDRIGDRIGKRFFLAPKLISKIQISP